MLFTPKPFTASNPNHNALYSASLLVAEKDSLKDYSKTIPSGEMMTTPTPEPRWLVAPVNVHSPWRGNFGDKNPNSFLALYTLLRLIFQELGDEVSQDLAFNRCPRLVLDVKSP